MRFFATAALATSLIVCTTTVYAADKCAYHPRSAWIPIDRAISKAESLGYDVRNVEADDGCWEVEGFDRNGAKIKLYLDPVSGEVVKLNGKPPRS